MYNMASAPSTAGWSGPDRSAAEQFLTLLDPGGIFDFRTFANREKDKADEVRRRPLTRTFHGTLDQHWDALVRLNERRAGIYVTVNKTDGRGRSAENVAAVRAHFAEFDSAEAFQAAVRKLTDVGLPPSIAVESSPGKHHIYWLVSGRAADIDNFKAIEQDLVAKLGAGRESVDISRVLRLPGFAHWKGEAAPVKLIGTRGSTYTVSEFDAALARLDVITSAAPVTPLQAAPGPRAAAPPPAPAATSPLASGAPAPIFRKMVGGVPSLAQLAQRGMPIDATQFDGLDPVEKLNTVKLALETIDVTKYNKQPGASADGERTRYDEWRNIVWSCCDAERRGAAGAVEACRAWSMGGNNYSTAAFDHTVRSDKPVSGREPITVGTLLSLCEGTTGVASLAAPQPAQVGLQQLTPPIPAPAPTNAFQSGLGLPVFDTTKITRRRELLGGSLVRGYLTILAAKTKSGKSTYVALATAALATGRELTGEWVVRPQDQPLRVLVINGEDTTNDLLGGFKATMILYGLTDFDLQSVAVLGKEAYGGWKLAVTSDRGIEMVDLHGITALNAYAAGFDVVIVDPLMAFVTADISNNAVMANLALQLGTMAARNNQAVLLVHHIAKGRSLETDGIDAATGAGALANHARVMLGIRGMMPQESEHLGVPAPMARRFVGVMDLASNLAEGSGIRWFERKSVELPGTAEPPNYPNNEHRPALRHFTPSSRGSLYSKQALAVALRVLQQGDGAGTPLSPHKQAAGRYAPELIASALAPLPELQGYDASQREAFAKSLLKELIERRWVAESDVRVPSGGKSGRGGSNNRRGLTLAAGTIPPELLPAGANDPGLCGPARVNGGQPGAGAPTRAAEALSEAPP